MKRKPEQPISKKSPPRATKNPISSKSREKTEPEDAASSNPPAADTSKEPFSNEIFPIVGVGASAGGLEAFSELLKHLPVNTGMGFVLVQHLSAGHESALPEILARTTKMPVIEAKDGLPVRPNEVYVIPENASLSISRGVLKLGAREKSCGRLRSVDFFLRSLAQDRGALAIGIVLSGTDFDGSAGIEAIKNEGGITLAQDEKSAKFESMPRSAAATGYVDRVLSPDKMGEELARLGASFRSASGTKPTGDRSVDDHDLKKVLQQVRARKGLDLTFYKPTTIQRRVKRRMLLSKVERLSDYVEYLGNHPEEVDALYHDVLINVTTFFRDPEIYESLKEKVFPQIVQSRTPDEPVRIWVAGCSTGQEAYSLAMSFLEFSANVGTQVPLQVFATDVNEASLEKARGGRYAKSQVQDISAERLRRFFIEQDGTLQICKPIREMCVFARHDIAKDPPFSRMDLVTCRNMLIYFEPLLQKKVFPVLHYALKANGFVVLGASETVGEFSDLFRVEDKSHKIYSKKASKTRYNLHLSEAHKEPRQGRTTNPSTPPLPIEAEAQREADRYALAKYAPAGVVVDADFEVLQFRGATGHYLEPMPGKASFGVLRMAREGLLVPLRAALQKAKKENLPVQKKDVPVRFNGHKEHVHLDVIPLKNVRERCFLILFEPAGQQSVQLRRLANEAEARRRVGTNEEAATEIARLQNEVAALKEHLQSTSEQFDATNEELQATNEEAQSANEELQSINEEVETTKEELESTNEELRTVNEEMNTRNVELNRTNSDLNNVLNGVQMCIVVLDRDLGIRRFTPLAQKVLNLIPTDTGRPLAHVKTNLQFLELDEFTNEAVQEGVVKQKDVQDKQGRWFSMRVLPYRTFDNRIDGAVLVLVDIDAIKRSENHIRNALEHAQATIETVREPMLVLNADLSVLSANRSFYNHFRVSPNETLGKFIYELGNGQWDVSALLELLEGILPTQSQFDDFEMTREFERIGRRTLLLNARRISDTGNQPERILLAIDDVTDRRSIDLLKDSEERYRRLAETLPQLVWTCLPNGQCDYFNAKYSEYTGVPFEKLLGDGWRSSISPIDRERTCNYWLEALRGNVPYDLDFRIQRSDGVYRWFKIRAVPLRDKTGEIIKWFGTSTDIEEGKRAQLILAESERWLRLIMESVQDFALFTLDNEGNVNTWTGGAQSVFGYTEEEIIGRPGAIIFTPEDRASGVPEQEMKTARVKGCALDERWHEGKDGRRMFLSGSMRVMRDENGIQQGFTKVARDITEKKEAAEKLEQTLAERTAKLRETIGELEAFSYSVSHDMRAPLRAMVSYTEMIRDEFGGQLDPVATDYLNRIFISAKRLDRLVVDILTYSRVERMTFPTESIDLDRLVRDVIDGEPNFHSPRVEIEVQPKLPKVIGHEVSLIQVVTNLIGNAVKFVSPGITPKVIIHSEVIGTVVRVWFDDNGIGIAKSDKERIFSLFGRLNPTTRFEGTGIGLTIVRKAIQRMGGQVGVESEPCNGSRFWIELNRSNEP